jgi:hypothetical protein
MEFLYAVRMRVGIAFYKRPTIRRQRHIGTPSQIRTESQLLLRESALPISVTGHKENHSTNCGGFQGTL